MNPPHQPVLSDFLSDHSSEEQIVAIKTEPSTIYFERGREADYLNFDIILSNLTDREIMIRFIKVAAYDEKDNLILYRYVNHNAVGTAGIHTLGRYELKGKEKIDVFNPFFIFPKDHAISYLRYMFTFIDKETREEFYYGNIILRPVKYDQKVRLHLPMKGLLTILDGHDFYSHHRRFAMTLVRQLTKNKFYSNFSRYALDFTVIGEDGNLRKMDIDELDKNYDFHMTDVKKFYTHEARVYAPAGGTVVDLVNHLDDLYEEQFNMDEAIKNDSIESIVGNYVVIKHNENEFSHLYHLLKDSIVVKIGQQVKQGDLLGKIGFSGAATTYSHLHYQLMDGADFLNDNSLPCEFSDVNILNGNKNRYYPTVCLDTGDFVYQ